jgi:hypothetical protein
MQKVSRDRGRERSQKDVDQSYKDHKQPCYRCFLLPDLLGFRYACAVSSHSEESSFGQEDLIGSH